MPSLKQIQSQKQKLAPRQVLQAKLLQLNTVNLEQAIIEELETNPILEEVESEEIEDLSKDEDSLENIDSSNEDVYTDESMYYLDQEKKEMPIPDRITFIESLINQLRDSGLNDTEQEIAESILWNTNERGYLDIELILIADNFGLEDNQIEYILSHVQHLEPKGFASRNLQECLLIQLENKVKSIEYIIIKKYFEDFMNKRYQKILNKIKCSEAELNDAINYISDLNPRPGEGYNDQFQTIIPDVIVREDGNDWLITTNDGGIPEVRINKTYEDKVHIQKYDGKAKSYIKEKLASANWFIEAVKQRRVTMVNVMKSIIKHQPEWFNGDLEFMRPLKQQDIAEEIKMDISTISRSTRGKFVDTPFGVFELKHFFTDAIKLNNGNVIGTFIIKRKLENILNDENKKNPLSDDILVRKLEKEGYSLARRTVAKYRDQMGIPVARLRKKLQ